MSTMDIKLKLAGAVRATEQAKSRVALYANNLAVMKIDLRNARETLTRRREHEHELRRELREAKRRERRR